MHSSSVGAREIVRFLMAPLLIAIMMVGFSLPAMRSPEPHMLEIGIVGSSADQMALIETFEWNGAGEFEFVTLESANKAREAVENGEIGSALVLNPEAVDRIAGSPFRSVPGVPDTLVDTAAVAYVASAYGSTLASGALLPLRDLALQLGTPLQVLDLQAMNADDISGVGMMFFALVGVLAGFLSVNVLAAARPGMLRVKNLVKVLVPFGTAITLIAYSLEHFVLGAIDGAFLPIFVTGLLTLLAAGFTTALLVKLLGRMAILLVMMIFVALGMPSSGAGTPIEFTSGFYRFFHEILPVPNAVDAIRAISYFDPASAWSHWAVLAAWIVVGAVGLELVHRRSSGDEKNPIPAASQDDVAVAAAL